MPLFAFPEDAHWNADLEAVEFGFELGEYKGTVRLPRVVLRRLVGAPLTPEACLAAYHEHRTRLERAAEAKLRRRELTEDGNVELSGRDLRVIDR